MSSNRIIFALLFTLSFAAFSAPVHVLAKEGRWEEVKAMISRGEATLKDLDDDQITTVEDIAKEHGALHLLLRNPAPARAPAPNVNGFRAVGNLNELDEATRIHVEMMCLVFGCDPSAISIKGSLGPRSN